MPYGTRVGKLTLHFFNNFLKTNGVDTPDNKIMEDFINILIENLLKSIHIPTPKQMRDDNSLKIIDMLFKTFCE